jgi:alkylresorcinol/alkylpyrone synthase
MTATGTGTGPGVRIRALGTALPEHVHKQADIVEGFFAAMPGWDPAWVSVFTASGVERRAAAIDVHAFYRPGSGETPGTAERMRAHPPAARALGAAAARRALERAGPGAAAVIGDLIAISCTGYAGPGLDVHLAADLGLDPGVRRLAIGHMGCYAALPGLRTAAALAGASGRGALVACVELCSLHLQPARSREEAVCQSLFGDGAAAALVAPAAAGEGAGPRIVAARSRTIPGTEQRMGWLIDGDGFRMSLSPRVPAIIERALAPLLAELLDPYGLTVPEIGHWVVHPGGPEILDRVGRRLGLADTRLARSREALADGGNRSSATVLFILESLLDSGEVQPGEWIVVLAFGTGLTLEALLLRA